jgi:hypothetical protein
MSYTRAWNENVPDGAEDKTLGDNRIREFKADIRERLATEHTNITGSLGQAELRHSAGRCSVAYYGSTSDINALSSPPQYAVAFDTTLKSWKYYTGSAWTRGDAIPSGSKMVFYQASAPAGWTQDTSVDDRALRVVNSSGGGYGGSWTISGLTGSGDVGSTTLSETQIPSHRHTIVAYSTTLSGNYNAHQHTRANFSTRLEPTGSSETTWEDDRYTEYTGGGQGHTHSLSGFSIGSDGTWRPAYINVIVCTKD